MIKNFFIFSDLDKTLIYSKRYIKDIPLNEIVCVEYKDNKPLSYMTKKAYDYFSKILAKSNFIPCSMRSLSQIKNIELFKNSIYKYMICYCGAEIYIDGKLDEEYNNLIKEKIDLNELLSFQSFFESYFKTSRSRMYGNYFIEIKEEDPDTRQAIFDFLSKTLNTNKYNISLLSTNKLYVTPIVLNKCYAMNYLINKNKNIKSIALGDSFVDYDFINYADYSFIPNHCELNSSKTIYKSEKDFIYGGEDILEKINDFIF